MNKSLKRIIAREGLILLGFLIIGQVIWYLSFLQNFGHKEIGFYAYPLYLLIRFIVWVIRTLTKNTLLANELDKAIQESEKLKKEIERLSNIKDEQERIKALSNAMAKATKIQKRGATAILKSKGLPQKEALGNLNNYPELVAEAYIAAEAGFGPYRQRSDIMNFKLDKIGDLKETNNGWWLMLFGISQTTNIRISSKDKPAIEEFAKNVCNYKGRSWLEIKDMPQSKGAA